MRHSRILGFCCGLLILAACAEQPPKSADTSEAPAPAAIVPVWPASLKPFGGGYPKAGDVCRRVGESAATADFLDDSAVLVGCPTDAPDAIAAVGGRSVGAVDGITLISISQGDANAGMPAAEAPPATEQGTITP